MQQDNGSFFQKKDFLCISWLHLPVCKIWTNSLCITLNAKDWPSVISCRLLTERYAALIKFCAALINVSDNQPFHFSQSSMIFIFWLHCWSNRECIYYIYHLFCFITFMQLPFWFSVLLYNPLCTGYTYRENTCYNENKMKVWNRLLTVTVLY